MSNNLSAIVSNIIELAIFIMILIPTALISSRLLKKNGGNSLVVAIISLFFSVGVASIISKLVLMLINNQNINDILYDIPIVSQGYQSFILGSKISESIKASGATAVTELLKYGISFIAEVILLIVVTFRKNHNNDDTE